MSPSLFRSISKKSLSVQCVGLTGDEDYLSADQLARVRFQEVLDSLSLLFGYRGARCVISLEVWLGTSEVG